MPFHAALQRKGLIVLSGRVRDLVDSGTLSDWSAKLQPIFELQILNSKSPNCVADAEERLYGTAVLSQTEAALTGKKSMSEEKRKLDSAARATLPLPGCGAGRGTLPQAGDILYLPSTSGISVMMSVR